MLTFDSQIDSIAFGQTGTSLAGLLFVSHNTASLSRTGEVGADGSDLTMVDLATLRTVAIARAGSRGDVVTTTRKGRVLLSQSTQVDVLNPAAAPKVIATNPPHDAVVALPWSVFSVTFDQDMRVAQRTDPSSVLNPANYALLDSLHGTQAPLQVLYDPEQRTARLMFATLQPQAYELRIADTVANLDGLTLNQPHVIRFTATSDLSGLVNIRFTQSRSERRSDSISYDVTVTNTSRRDLYLPLVLVSGPGPLQRRRAARRCGSRTRRAVADRLVAELASQPATRARPVHARPHADDCRHSWTADRFRRGRVGDSRRERRSRVSVDPRHSSDGRPGLHVSGRGPRSRWTGRCLCAGRRPHGDDTGQSQRLFELVASSDEPDD